MQICSSGCDDAYDVHDSSTLFESCNFCSRTEAINICRYIRLCYWSHIQESERSSTANYVCFHTKLKINLM